MFALLSSLPPNIQTRLPWKRLRVGDLAKVEKNELLPADLVILTTTARDGISYVETSNLDGNFYQE